MPSPEISLTFPCYNEEANIEPMLETSLRVLERCSKRFEIVVANDGSTDQTGPIADRYAKRHPGVVRVLHLNPNRGYGQALAAGLRAARFEWVFFTDGDRQFDLEEIDRLLPFLDDHDIVTGYRGQRRDPPHRKLFALGWNTLARLLLGVSVRDVNCAFRFYRRSFLEAIPIESTGAMINMEVYARARRLKMRIKEVEVSHYPRVAGTPTGGDPRVIARAFRELLGLWWKLK